MEEADFTSGEYLRERFRFRRCGVPWGRGCQSFQSGFRYSTRG